MIGLFYLLTSAYPLCSDDFGYALVRGTTERISNIQQIIERQIFQYLNWTGRMIAHFIAQGFLLFPKAYYDIANTVCYAFCTFGIARLASKKHCFTLWLLSLLTLWVLMPQAGSSMLWLTGSCNYLFSSFFIVFFLLLTFSETKWQRITAIILGIIAGNGHECLSSGLVVALVLYACFSPKKDLLFYAAIAAFIIGSLSNILAPGSYARLGHAGHDDIDITKTVFSFAKVIWIWGLKNSDISFHVCRVASVVTGVVCIYQLRKGQREYLLPLCLIIGGLITLGLNAITHCYYDRSFYGVCFITYLATFLVIGYQMKHPASALCFILLLSAFSLNVAEVPKAFQAIKALKQVLANVEQCAQTHKTYISPCHNLDNPLLSRYIERYSLSPCVSLNTSIIRYHKLHELSILPEPICNYLDENQDSLKSLPFAKTATIENDCILFKLEQKPKSAITETPIQLIESPQNLITSIKRKITTRKTALRPVSIIYAHGSYWAYITHYKAGSNLKLTYPNGLKQEFIL